MGQSYDKMILNNPQIDVVYDNTTPGWDQAAAQKNAEAALQKEPNIDAFLCMWDNCAQAVAQAVKAAGKQPGHGVVDGKRRIAGEPYLHRPGLAGPDDLDAVRRHGEGRREHRSRVHHGSEPPKPDSTSTTGAPVINPPLFSVTKDTLCEYIKTYTPRGLDDDRTDLRRGWGRHLWLMSTLDGSALRSRTGRRFSSPGP